MTVEIAIGKARTAVASGRDTSTFERAVDGAATEGGHAHGRPRPPRLALLTAPHLVAMEGAVPIIVDGVCVGAVSVAPQETEALCQTLSDPTAAQRQGAQDCATRPARARASCSPS